VFALNYITQIPHWILSRYINLIGYGHIVIIILIISLSSKVGIIYLLMIYLDLSVIGGALAIILTDFINIALETMFIFIYKPLPEAIFCFNSESFDLIGIKHIMKTYASVVLIVISVMINKEILILVAFSLLNTDELSAFIIIIQITRLLFSVSAGIGLATVNIVGYYIGKKEFKKVFPIYFYTTIFSFSIVSILCIFLAIFKNQILRNILHNEVVINYILECIPYICTFCVMESISINISYWLRGLNAKIFTIVVLCVQYLIIQPSLSVLLIKSFNLGVKALIISCLCGELFTLSIMYIYMIFFLNYEKACKDVLDQIDLHHEEVLQYINLQQKEKNEKSEKSELRNENSIYNEKSVSNQKDLIKEN